MATYSPRSGRVTLEQQVEGNIRTVAVASRSAVNAEGLAFVLCENQATALLRGADGWGPVVTARRNIAAFSDYRDPALLKRLQYAYGIQAEPAHPATRWPSVAVVGNRGLPQLRKRRSEDSARQELPASGQRGGEAASASDGELLTPKSVRAGLFGRVGLRDPHVVQLPDGTPYVRDGCLYLTMTCAGLGFFQQAHWGVFALDLNDLSRLEQVAQLYFTRDGKVLGDHAGQIVVDGDRHHVLVSSWGDFEPGTIHTRYTVTADDVLSGTHVLESQPLRLPTSAGSWDPAVTRVGDRWYVAFVASPSQHGTFDFHPALAASSPGGSYDEGLELVGEDDSSHQCEGPILAPVSDALVSTPSAEGPVAAAHLTNAPDGAESDIQWRLLASDRTAAEFPVYDLQMRRVGTLNAPYGTNIPHPQVVTVPGPRGPRHLLITFDGTPFGESVLGYGTHGDLVVLEAQPDSVA